jgi:hypothetical protein
MPLLASLETLDLGNRRFAPRTRLHLDSRIGTDGEQVTIHDISSTGMLIETTVPIAEFGEIEIELPEVGTTIATVMWNSGHYFGCQFHSPISRAAISAALLCNPFERIAAEPDRLPAAEPSASLLELAVPVSEPSEAPDDDHVDNRYSLTVRLRAILGASIALWALILWAIGVL